MMETKKQQDMSIKWSTFLLKNIGLWIAENPAEERRRRLMLSYTLSTTIFSLIIACRDIYFTWFYKGDVFYVTTNFFSLLLAVVKVHIIRMRRDEFLDLIFHMQEKFLDVSYDFHENEIVNNCRKICTFFVCSVTAIGFCVMVLYIVAPYIGRSENDAERMLPFNMWFNLIPLSKSPYYEAAMVIEMVSLYYMGLCYFCFDNIFCIMAIHLSGQFRVLQYRLKKLCDIEYQISEKDPELVMLNHVNKSYEKFRSCVRQHQNLIRYCDKLEHVYTMIILGQVVVSSLLICLFGYQILLAEATSARRSIFVWLIIGLMFLLFMFTYSCDCVMEQSDSVAIGVYSALWTIMPMNKAGRMLRNDLILVIGRSRRVCCLTAYGFFPVSLATYTTILSTALSYFTLLRGSVEETTET